MVKQETYYLNAFNPSITNRLRYILNEKHEINKCLLCNKEILDIINKNSIIFIEGPGGCLTKENKIYIYIMKSKNKKHNIIYEENTDKNNFIG